MKCARDKRNGAACLPGRVSNQGINLTAEASDCERLRLYAALFSGFPLDAMKKNGQPGQISFTRGERVEKKNVTSYPSHSSS